MTDTTLLIGGEEIDDIEWAVEWETSLGQVGTATATVQDKANAGNLIGVDREPMELKISGTTQWLGEIVDSELSLPAGEKFRRWKLTGADLMTALDLRINAIGGGLWANDGNGDYPIADFPNNTAHDQSTVQDIFDALVGSSLVTFDTSTHVYQWIANGTLNDGLTGNPNISWANITPRAMLDDLRGYGGFPIYLHIWPDGKVLWIAAPPNEKIGGGTVSIAAPAALTDDNPNGTTTVGFRDLVFHANRSFAPQKVYVNGSGPFIYNGGLIVTQGTGWSGDEYGGQSDKISRAIMVDAQAVSTAQRDAVGAAYKALGAQPIIQGSVKVGAHPDDIVDDWRPGQMLNITCALLPDDWNGLDWLIQSVHGKVVPGPRDYREYTIGFGTAPRDRFSQRFGGTAKVVRKRIPSPAIRHKVTLANATTLALTNNVLPNVDYLALSQAIDNADNSIQQAGLQVNWTVDEIHDAAATPFTDSDIGFTFDSASLSTNKDGVTMTKFRFTTVPDGAVVSVFFDVIATTPGQ